MLSHALPASSAAHDPVEVAIFTVMQTTASILVSVAAVLLLVATCLSRPHRWCISSGTFFAIYAAFQAAVVGLVVTTARKLEDGERSARGCPEYKLQWWARCRWLCLVAR